MKFNDFLNMAGCTKSSCGTVVRTGAVTRYDFPSDISLWYAFGKNLMMWTQKSNKKLFQNRLASYFHRQSDENRIMRTVIEIRTDFNWNINLMNILMFTCSLISFCHFIYFRLSPLFRFGFWNISIEYKKNPQTYYLICLL